MIGSTIFDIKGLKNFQIQNSKMQNQLSSLGHKIFERFLNHFRTIYEPFLRPTEESWFCIFEFFIWKFFNPFISKMVDSIKKLYLCNLLLNSILKKIVKFTFFHKIHNSLDKRLEKFPNQKCKISFLLWVVSAALKSYFGDLEVLIFF